MREESAGPVFKACALAQTCCALRNAAREWAHCQNLIRNLFDVDSAVGGSGFRCTSDDSDRLREEFLAVQITADEEAFARSARHGLDVIGEELRDLLKHVGQSQGSRRESGRTSIPPLCTKDTNPLCGDGTRPGEDDPFAAEMDAAARDFAQKRLDRVIVRLRQLIERCGTGSGRAPALYHALGVAFMESGDLNQARRQLLAALSSAHTSPTEPLTSDILDDLGMVYLYQGRLGAAARTHRRALGGNIRRGDQRRVARSCEHMGLAAWKRGDARAAIGWVLVSLSLRCRQGLGSDLADSMDSLGRICSSMKFHSVALPLHYHALGHRFAVGDHPATAKTWTNLGVTFRRLEQLPSSLYCHRQAMRIRRHYRDRIGMANSYNNLGVTLMKLGSLRSARKQIRKALRLRYELGDSLNVSRNLANLRSIEAALRAKAGE